MSSARVVAESVTAGRTEMVAVAVAAVLAVDFTVMVAVPGDLAVTRPADETVAMVVLEELHVTAGLEALAGSTEAES